MRDLARMRRIRCILALSAGFCFILAWLLFLGLAFSPITFSIGLIALAGGHVAARYLLRAHDRLNRVIWRCSCHQCGYDVMALTSGRCPECGWPLGEPHAT
jgi:fatty acid desaturase